VIEALHESAFGSSTLFFAGFRLGIIFLNFLEVPYCKMAKEEGYEWYQLIGL
jgi:hypothetical protein